MTIVRMVRSVAQLASAHNARTVAKVPQASALLISCLTYVPPSASSVSFLDEARQLLRFGLSQTQQRRRALRQVVPYRQHVYVLAQRVACFARWNRERRPRVVVFYS